MGLDVRKPVFRVLDQVRRKPARSAAETCQNIRIYHECEGGMEKSVLRITDWHHEACRVMKNCDPERWIFLSHPHMNNELFFLLTSKYLILYWKT